MYRLATDTRNKSCNAVVDDIDAGGGPGKIEIRTLSQPTNVDDADTGLLLGTLTFSSPAYGNSANGTATAAAIASDLNADNSGTATQFRIKDSTNAIHSDGTCGVGSGELQFDNNVVVAGGILAIASFTTTAPIS